MVLSHLYSNKTCFLQIFCYNSMIKWDPTKSRLTGIPLISRLTGIPLISPHTSKFHTAPNFISTLITHMDALFINMQTIKYIVSPNFCPEDAINNILDLCNKIPVQSLSIVINILDIGQYWADIEEVYSVFKYFFSSYRTFWCRKRQLSDIQTLSPRT